MCVPKGGIICLRILHPLPYIPSEIMRYCPYRYIASISSRHQTEQKMPSKSYATTSFRPHSRIFFASRHKEFKPSFSNTEVPCVPNLLWKISTDRSGLSSTSTDLCGHLDMQKAGLWHMEFVHGGYPEYAVFQQMKEGRQSQGSSLCFPAAAKPAYLKGCLL